ncbi:MAG: XisH family protein [Cyanobacteria bacterium SBC]|nr:XisH family protein [Cyanobacteria bacterium SBC]
MPAKDLYHDAVKKALKNDGWTIVVDPFIIHYEDAELYADLAAEKPIAAERQGQNIVVEIKSFVGKSPMTDFHNALGQYIVYRNLIQLTEPQYQLFLAIDSLTYSDFFQRPSIQIIVRQNSLNLLVADIPQERLEQWIA